MYKNIKISHNTPNILFFNNVYLKIVKIFKTVLNIYFYGKVSDVVDNEKIIIKIYKYPVHSSVFHSQIKMFIDYFPNYSIIWKEVKNK